MQNEEVYQKDIDNKLESLFNETGREMLSDNFTEKIMKQIETKSLAAEFLNKPVITAKWWYFLASIFLFISIFSVTQFDSTGTRQFILESFQFVSSINIFQGFTISIAKITNSLFTSYWFLSFAFFTGIAGFNFYLQQRFTFQNKD